ncbi:unnamed protein product, partial [marine sediment metagenome]
MNSENPDSKKNDQKTSEKDDGLQTLALLQDIRNGSIDPKSLRPDERRPLVALLMAEGQSTAEIAHVLKASDRIIQLDKRALREENTITKDPKLVKQMVGRLVAEADLCIQRIRKFARGKDTPASVKVDGEHRCFQIFEKTTERLQSLGFLPTAAQKIEADLTHRPAASLTLEEIRLEARRLIQIEKSLPAEEIKQDDSAIEANETVTEFEDNSPQQDNNRGGNNH